MKLFTLWADSQLLRVRVRVRVRVSPNPKSEAVPLVL